MKRKLALFAFAMSAGFAFGDNIIWSGYTNISGLYATQGRLIFNTEYSNELSTCDGGKRFSFAFLADDYETQVAVLMAAFFSGKQINMAFDDEQGATCSPIINRFRVK